MTRPNINFVTAGACTRKVNDWGDPVVLVANATSHTETTSGVSRHKPQGFIPPTAYSYFHRTIAYANGSCSNFLRPPGFGQSFVGVVGDLSHGGRFSTPSHFDEVRDESDVEGPTLRNRALVKARNALKGTDINLGVAFAERSATARLVGDTAIGLARAYRSLRRGEVRNAMRYLGISSKRREPRGNSAPQKWLELQYGWKPLLSDIHGACEVLSKSPKSDWRVTAKGRATAKDQRSKKFLDPECGTVTAEAVSSCFVRIDALPQNEAIISFVSSGITNPLLIGWELVPFSFVVDWFLPVGGWLESLDALLGYTTAGYSSSLLTRISWVGVSGPKTVLSSGFVIDDHWSENKKVVRLVRDVSTSVPQARFPSFKDGRSLAHMANGLSLLATAFGRK
jgi:hypothetical protein